MSGFRLITDSLGAGEHGKYLADLEERLGVVVEFFLFAAPPNAAGDETVHTQIARLGMIKRCKRNEEYFDNLRRSIIADPDRYAYSIDPNKLGPDDRFSLTYEIDKSKSAIIGSDQFVREYRYAFTDPPYPIRCPVHRTHIQRAARSGEAYLR